MSSETLAPLTLDKLEAPFDQRFPPLRVWIWGFLALGIGLRLLRYLLPFPLWGDEAFVAANFLEIDYLGLLGPLEYHQICPPLFLWVEQACVQVFGFSEYSLRLFPFLCGIASLFLFRHVAGRFLQGVPLLIAVALFAVSYYPIRHGAEVKPYASDLLVSLGLIALAVEYLRHPQQTKWLWALGAFVPLGLWLSFPAVFVAGGISLALLWSVWKQRSWHSRLAFGSYQLTMVGSFAALYFWIMRPIKQALPEQLHNFWADAFPPLESLLGFVQWFVEVHTAHMMAYPIGGGDFGSTITTVCVVVALGYLVYRREWTWLSLFVAPFGVAMVAAFVRAYPYGGSARVMQYVAPMICLLAAFGVAWLVSQLRSSVTRQRALMSVLGLYVLLGGGQAVRDVTTPQKTKYDLVHAGFARWFWEEMDRDAELVCLHSDEGIDFLPQQWKEGLSSVYLCYQRLYRASEGEKSQPFPRRFVVFRGWKESAKVRARREAWLLKMQEQFSLQREMVFPVNQSLPKHACEYVVYEFVPLQGPTRLAEKP